jgi:hypothetical protein
MTTRHEVLDMPMVDTKLLLAAACAAYRINGGYINQARLMQKSGDKSEMILNRDIAKKCIHDQSVIMDVDRDLATKCYNFYMANIMNILSDTPISDFEKNVVDIIKNETVPFTNYSLGVTCYIPKGYHDGIKRKELYEKLNCSNGAAIGTINEKITLDINVLVCYNSKETWVKNCLIKGLTDDNNTINFWISTPLEVGKKYNITGMVKAHQINQQYRTVINLLSRVKINS